jgi:hypothetical protein
LQLILFSTLLQEAPRSLIVTEFHEDSRQKAPFLRGFNLLEGSEPLRCIRPAILTNQAKHQPQRSHPAQLFWGNITWSDITFGQSELDAVPLQTCAP